MGRQYSRRRTDALDYLQEMLGQLRIIAQAERCDMLAYFIEMAYLEAGDIIRGDRPMRFHDEEFGSALRSAGNQGDQAS